ncbi:hypothetical protein ZIOFF_058380 [Zingiber officinale]|uniref:Uncharacterized protein n=1 Tax=Zingiber officinale TaxID=94328 RepID=A0A8J5KHU4_ZINOF|nr:hypothetical protein ZIOFF_058380 [Zingiber officinale]
MGAEPPSLATTKLGFPYTATKLIFPMRPSLFATKLGFPSPADPSPADKLVMRVIKLQISILTVSLVTALSFMRQIRAEIGVVVKADGSALFQMGNTKVIAAVYGPRETLYRNIFSNLPNNGSMYSSTFDATLPGIRSACINAATLALADAGILMRDIVTSCSAGYLSSTPLLDLNYVEDSAGGPDVTVGILTKMDKVTLLRMDSKLPIDIFENVMQLAIEGCKAIAQYIREVLLENTKLLESCKGL